MKYVIEEFDSMLCDDSGGQYGWFNHYKGTNVFEAVKAYFEALKNWEGFEYAADIVMKKDYGKPGNGKGGKRIKKYLRQCRIKEMNEKQTICKNGFNIEGDLDGDEDILKNWENYWEDLYESIS